MIKFIKSLYIQTRFFVFLIGIVILFVLGHFLLVFFTIAKFMLIIGLTIFFIDLMIQYLSAGKKILAKRQTPERLSNGDDNEIKIFVKNHYAFPVYIEVIDEIPHQFQYRDFSIKFKLEKFQEKSITYKLHPLKRGEYSFGNLNIYTTTIFGFISKRYKFDTGALVPVYPSFIQMRKYELMAISNRLTEVGIKKIRRISNNKEFEEIREYVSGDDYRTINWKATARKSSYMVNQFQDEKSQQVYCLIDMGRTMKMPFDGLSLLDYTINASLVISNIAMLKHDKAGIITFSKEIHTILQANRKSGQMNNIMEILYRQKTNFDESDYEPVFINVKRRIANRSLLLLFTNFEGMYALQRQLNSLRQLSKNHLLVVIFFENTEIKQILKTYPEDIENIYIKTIAEKSVYDKRLMVKELQKYGIQVILTEPNKLTINTINKYLELKARGLI